MKIRCMMPAGAAAFALVAASVPASRATDIVAGPMVGQVTDNTVRVWMQINTIEKVSIRAVDVTSGKSPGTVTLDVEGPAPFVADLPVSQLEPNRNYRIDVEFDGKPVKMAEPLIVRTAPSVGELANFSMAIAAGIDAGADGKNRVPAAAALADGKAQGVLFLGNLGLLPAKEADFPKTRREAFGEMSKMLQAVRANADMQPVYRLPSLAVWGERDFGPEVSGKNFAYARESLLAFRRFWPNPMYGTGEARGVFFKSTYADVDFFALDARMNRDGKEMLGAGQLAWLKEELASSKANMKVIASSSPLLGDEEGSWGKYAEERESFVEHVFKQQIKGVVFVSAGSYGRILCRKAADTSAYPLYELVCPPLNVKATSAADEPLRLGDPFSGNGFGTLVFGGGSKPKRFVTLEIRDEKGRVMRDQTIFAGNLGSQ